jgi:antitoxin component of MazEF toxin-antitoxin module
MKEATRPNQYSDNNVRKVQTLHSSPNSIWVVLPKELMEQAKIKAGDAIEFKMRSDGTVCFNKVKVDKRKKAKA